MYFRVFIKFRVSTCIHDTRYTIHDTRYRRVSCIHGHISGTVSKTNEYRSSNLFAYNNSINILWALAIQTSWYLLPGYQFVALSQNYIHTLGNSHYCYYDYLCAKPFDIQPLKIHVNSLHNILSNGPYISLGIFYMILVGIRQCILKRKQKTAILISLGFSLAMEGIFSAIYHVCPSKYNFQFDTTFMYTMLSLLIAFVLYLNSPVSLTRNYKSSSKGLGIAQEAKTQEHKQVSQWLIFAALILLAWLVVLYENLEKKSARFYFLFSR